MSTPEAPLSSSFPPPHALARSVSASARTSTGQSSLLRRMRNFLSLSTLPWFESAPQRRPSLPVPERKRRRAREVDRHCRPGRTTRQGEGRIVLPAAEQTADFLGGPQQEASDEACEKTTRKLE